MTYGNQALVNKRASHEPSSEHRAERAYVVARVDSLPWTRDTNRGWVRIGDVWNT